MITVVGVGEGGVAALGHEARAVIAAADTVLGPPRLGKDIGTSGGHGRCFQRHAVGPADRPDLGDLGRVGMGRRRQAGAEPSDKRGGNHCTTR